MGFWALFEYSISEYTTIDASCDAVWKIVSDLDNYHRILSGVESTERMDGSKSTDPLTVGTKLRRRVVVGGGNSKQVLVSDLTVTAIDDDDDNKDDYKKGAHPRTLSVYADNVGQRLTGRISWTVSPASEEGGGKSRLLISTTILPKRLCLCFGGRFAPVCCFRAMSSKMLRSDIQEFAKAAVALERAKQG